MKKTIFVLLLLITINANANDVLVVNKNGALLTSNSSLLIYLTGGPDFLGINYQHKITRKDESLIAPIISGDVVLIPVGTKVIRLSKPSDELYNIVKVRLFEDARLMFAFRNYFEEKVTEYSANSYNENGKSDDLD